MTTDEKVDNLTEKYSDLHTVVNVLANKVDNLANEMQDFKNEMRDRDNRRAAENEEIRNDIKEIYKTTDAKIAEIRTSVDGIAKHVQNFSIAAFVGIGAMVVTSVIGIAAMVWAVIPKG